MFTVCTRVTTIRVYTYDHLTLLDATNCRPPSTGSTKSQYLRRRGEEEKRRKTQVRTFANLENRLIFEYLLILDTAEVIPGPVDDGPIRVPPWAAGHLLTVPILHDLRLRDKGMRRGGEEEMRR